MAQIHDCNNQHKSTKPSPRNSCLLGCFGFSQKTILSDKDASDDYMEKAGGRRKRRWLSFSQSLKKKYSTAKNTVPVDLATTVSKSGRNSKEDSFVVKPTKDDQMGSSKVIQIPATKSAQIPAAKPNNTHVFGNPHKSAHNTIRDNPNSPKDTKCHKTASFGDQKPGAKGTCDNNNYQQPASPVSKSNKSRSTAAQLSQSSSFPPPKHTGQELINATGVVGKPQSFHRGGDHSTTTDLGDTFDSMVGMSIIMVTLIVMFLWGKLCAILCTGAWFYFIPRLRGGSPDPNGGSIFDDDHWRKVMNSTEHKKRVVLYGLLERKQQYPKGHVVL